MLLLSGKSDAHIGALDGLRAAAIGLVLLFHLTPGRDSNQGLRALPYKLADIGWTGVDLFFVLSGFLITMKLLGAREDEHRFRDFYVRRALRIFPLYYGVLLVLMLVGRPPLRAQLPYWLYYSNFVHYPLPTDAFAPIGHFWSLAIEEQFYLVWPAVIFFCSRRVATAVCIAIAAGAPLLRLALAANGFDWVTTYAWTPSRADGLALGSLVALAGTNRRLAWLAIAAATPLLGWCAWRGKAFHVVTNSMTAEGIALRTLLPSAAALLFAGVLMVALEANPRWLSSAPLRAIATYSYGMYVVHFMLLPVLKERLSVSPLLFFAIGSAISFLLAAASYHAYESLFLRLKTRFA